jgi:hypothetical protein
VSTSFTIELRFPGMEARASGQSPVRSVLVRPPAEGRTLTGHGTAPDQGGTPPSADLEILPGHQPLTAVLPPRTEIFKVLSPAGLSGASRPAFEPLKEIFSTGCVLRTSNNESGTTVTIIPLGE